MKKKSIIGNVFGIIISVVLLVAIVFSIVLGFKFDKTKDNSDKMIATTFITEQSSYDMPTISDCKIDQNYDISRTNMFFFDHDSKTWVDIDNANFDLTKPTVVYSHGQGGGTFMPHPEGFDALGYNILAFWWGDFADDDIVSIEKKIWVNINRWADDDGAYHKLPEFGCTIPELYVARYCDFFAKYPSYNMPIQVCGHSYGGQLTVALSGYFTKLGLEGRMDPRLMPIRFTAMDPYFDNLNQNFDCKWLGTTIKHSSVGAAIYIIDNYIEPYKIAFEMLRTSPAVEMAVAMDPTLDDPNYDYLTKIKNRVRIIELQNPNEILRQVNDGTAINPLGIGNLHIVATDFYFSANSKPIYYDSEGGMCFGKLNNTSFVIGTYGYHYDLNVSSENYKDFENATIERTTTPETKNSTKICGLVAYDYNNNGKFDEGGGFRLNGVRVTITDNISGETNEIVTTNGYYEFDAIRGNTYTVQTFSSNYQSAKQELTASNYVNTLDFSIAK